MKWSGYARAAAAALVLGALVAGPASAQITTGTVAGSVKDDQGLAVPGASVTLISEARGTRMAPVVTSGTGDFVVPNVTPDTYTVEVAMPGFTSTRRDRPGSPRRWSTTGSSRGSSPAARAPGTTSPTSTRTTART